MKETPSVRRAMSLLRVAFEPRRNPQGKINGIDLNGYSSETIWSDWSDPVGDNGETEGSACPGFSPPGPSTHPAKEWIPEGTTATALFVSFGGTSVQIWPED